MKRTATRKTKTPQKTAKRRKGGEECRADAMRLLAEGYLVGAVAAEVGVDRGTVQDWRDSPDGRAELALARKAREDTFKDAAESARRAIRESLDRAVQELVDQLTHRDPAVRSLAARTLLDRGGVPRTQRVESAAAPEGDLAHLSDDELAAYESLRRKVRGEG